MYSDKDNGNLTIAEKQNSASVKQEKWVYSWNPRDQMTKAEKFTGTSDTYAGKVEYRYCLSCDSALSDRIEYSPTVSTTITSWKRYEYDGLNLLRVDERYDTAGGAIDANDPWRTLEVNTHSPGLVGNLVGKRAYRHTDNDATPNATYDYVYVYDAVGNLYLVLNDEGGEEYAFSQDAWGNELSIGSFYGTSWSSARTYGVSEHQTGKWLDPFTGLYFFHHRWYESGLGRWVSREPSSSDGPNLYISVYNSPPNGFDQNGAQSNMEDPYFLWPEETDRTICVIRLFRHYYRLMKEANFIGADKYFHCMAHCESKKQCGAGDIARDYGRKREVIDSWLNWFRGKPNDSESDIAANDLGLACPSDKECKDQCDSVRPKGLPGKY
ncbi:MAG: hypothetical protein GHCLOJNM_01680 [bacterium]|nr:hypothetical protein [bacterium]